MNRSFSPLQVAVCALVLAGAGLSALPARAQSTDYGFHLYHYEPYHFSSTQPQPYQYKPFHSTFDQSSDYHSTYDGSSHSSDSEGGPAEPYHSFTMDPPYAPSSTPKYRYENGTITGPSGPVRHDNLGQVDVNALQKRGADVTFHDPFFAPKTDKSPFSQPPAFGGDQKARVGFVITPSGPTALDKEKAHERFFDSPPGPYGSATPIVNPVVSPGN